MIKKIESPRWTIDIFQFENDIFIGSVREIKPCHAQAKSLHELIERIEITIKFMCDAQPKIAEFLADRFNDIEVSKDNFDLVNQNV